MQYFNRMLLNKYGSNLTQPDVIPLTWGKEVSRLIVVYLSWPCSTYQSPWTGEANPPLFDHLAVPLCRCLERTVVTHLLELIFPYGHSQNHHASQCVLTPWPRVCARLRNNQIPLLEMFRIVSKCWLHIIRSNALVFCETQYFALASDTFCTLLVSKSTRFEGRWELTLQIQFDKWEFLSESMQSGAVIHFVSSSRQNCRMR